MGFEFDKFVCLNPWIHWLPSVEHMGFCRGVSTGFTVKTRGDITKESVDELQWLNSDGCDWCDCDWRSTGVSTSFMAYALRSSGERLWAQSQICRGACGWMGMFEYSLFQSSSRLGIDTTFWIFLKLPKNHCDGKVEVWREDYSRMMNKHPHWNWILQVFFF